MLAPVSCSTSLSSFQTLSTSGRLRYDSRGRTRALPLRSSLPSPSSSSSAAAAPSLCLTSRAGEKIASRLARVRCASSNESEADVITEAAARSEGEMKCGCGNCDGEGRIIGGMGSLPGFGWWPIKAYRPCPNFVQSGQQYKRKGQITDDIMFGRKGEQTRF